MNFRACRLAKCAPTHVFSMQAPPHGGTRRQGRIIAANHVVNGEYRIGKRRAQAHPEGICVPPSMARNAAWQFLLAAAVIAGRDQVVETAMFVDIPHLMIQAGVNPFPPQTAAHLVQPGPATHNGLMDAPQDAAEGDKTLALINAMISDLGTWQSDLPLEEELARTWNDDMIWWGPAGIGATYTIERYAQQHAGPFRASFTNRTGTGHLCRLAEGEFGGFFGWPNFTAQATGGFMGLPATGKAGEFRVIDVYRRGGEKLSENWVFIDLLHWLHGQGVDVLGRLRAGQ